ncbi:hypothetical protein Gohar_010737 [Gossypium harknessii]|uniref:Uncharacterized protein n=2 Tax=Gossypium TaxID=3633 RepID=A0A7J8PE70_GOSRA|nr:hypothetical protein [Gossypium raimondii]MBA0800295.1 hypothetical protein [Gossypium harknessii]
MGQIPNADPSNARSVSPDSDASWKDQRVRTGLEDLLKMPKDDEEPFVVMKIGYPFALLVRDVDVHRLHSTLTMTVSDI